MLPNIIFPVLRDCRGKQVRGESYEIHLNLSNTEQLVLFPFFIAAYSPNFSLIFFFWHRTDYMPNAWSGNTEGLGIPKFMAGLAGLLSCLTQRTNMNNQGGHSSPVICYFCYKECKNKGLHQKKKRSKKKVWQSFEIFQSVTRNQHVCWIIPQ